MAYFTHTEACSCYPDEWEHLLSYIKTEWSKNYASDLTQLEYQIEAKASYVFTMSRHLIEAAESLPRRGNWKPVFVEASLLLFPMLELVGQARLGDEKGEVLGSGIDWLLDPEALPRCRTARDLKADGE
jgi:hypothetical protein